MSNTKKVYTRIQNKHDYEYNWLQAKDFIPLAGELIIYDPDVAAPSPMTGSNSLPRIKIGDGKTLLNNLDFLSYKPVRGIDFWTDADKAEIKSYVDDAILNGEW